MIRSGPVSSAGALEGPGGAPAKRWRALVVVLYSILGLVAVVVASAVVAELPADPVRARGGSLALRVGPACGAERVPEGVACFDAVNVTVQGVGEAARPIALGEPSVTTGWWETTVRAETAQVEVSVAWDEGAASGVVYVPESDRVFVTLEAGDPVVRSSSPAMPPPRAIAQAVLLVDAVVSLVVLVSAWQWFRSDALVWGRRTGWALVTNLALSVVAPFLAPTTDPWDPVLAAGVAAVLLANTWQWVMRRRQWVELAQRTMDRPALTR